MRTVKEVRKKLSGQYHISGSGTDCYLHKFKSGDIIYSVQFHQLDEAINTCLIKLWNDEEIVEAKALNETLYSTTPKLIFLTNKRRLFIVSEGSSTTSGFIFDHTTYGHGMNIIELDKVDPNKCRILEIQNTSFFGKPKPAVNGDLILNDKEVLKMVNLEALNEVYKAILKNIKDYAEKPAEPKPKESAPSSQSGNVAEIRKMYEDGLITREEMLDLIKSIVSK